MRELALWIVGILAVVTFFLALAFLIEGTNFFLYSVFAPKYAETQRQVFENTPSYNQGMLQTLYKDEGDYARADPDGKRALRPVILHEAAAYPEDRMPPDLRQFIEQLKHDQATGQ